MHENRSNKHLLMYNSVLIDHTKCSAKVEKLRIEGVIFFFAKVLLTTASDSRESYHLSIRPLVL